MIREIGDDSLGRWDGESDPQCDHCQQPLPKEDAVELDGEPVHWWCANEERVATDGGAEDLIPARVDYDDLIGADPGAYQAWQNRRDGGDGR